MCYPIRWRGLRRGAIGCVFGIGFVQSQTARKPVQSRFDSRTNGHGPVFLHPRPPEKTAPQVLGDLCSPLHLVSVSRGSVPGPGRGGWPAARDHQVGRGRVRWGDRGAGQARPVRWDRPPPEGPVCTGVRFISLYRAYSEMKLSHCSRLLCSASATTWSRPCSGLQPLAPPISVNLCGERASCCSGPVGEAWESWRGMRTGTWRRRPAR